MCILQYYALPFYYMYFIVLSSQIALVGPMYADIVVCVCQT